MNTRKAGRDRANEKSNRELKFLKRASCTIYFIDTLFNARFESLVYRKKGDGHGENEMRKSRKIEPTAGENKKRKM